MRRAGTAITSTQGMVILRSQSDDPPSIGSSLVDESLDRVGQVVDIIGPTARPYLVVNPDEDRSAASLLGKPFYLR